MASNWPLGAADLRKALEYEVNEDDGAELLMCMLTACSLIDRHTGRHVEANRHELPNGMLPIEFLWSAREQAKHMWNQTKNGPRARPDDVPKGVGMLAKVEKWLEPYPPRLFYGGSS